MTEKIDLLSLKSAIQEQRHGYQDYIGRELQFVRQDLSKMEHWLARIETHMENGKIKQDKISRKLIAIFSIQTLLLLVVALLLYIK